MSPRISIASATLAYPYSSLRIQGQTWHRFCADFGAVSPSTGDKRTSYDTHRHAETLRSAVTWLKAKLHCFKIAVPEHARASCRARCPRSASAQRCCSRRGYAGCCGRHRVCRARCCARPMPAGGACTNGVTLGLQTCEWAPAVSTGSPPPATSAGAPMNICMRACMAGHTLMPVHGGARIHAPCSGGLAMPPATHGHPCADPSTMPMHGCSP